MAFKKHQCLKRKKKSFPSRLLGEKEHFKLAEMGLASGEAEFSLSASVNELFKSVYNHPNILRHEGVSQCCGGR